jgi:O-antigen ligase
MEKNSIQSNDSMLCKERLGNFFFLIMLFTLPLIQLSKVLKLPSLESALFSLTFILLIGCFISLFLRNPTLSIPYFICMLIVVLAICAVLYSADEISLSYFNKVFIFFATVLGILFVTQYPMNLSISDYIYRIAFIQSFIFAFAFFTKRTYNYGILESVTFGFSNPNFTGMWLLHLICIIIVYVMKKVSDKKYFLAIFGFAIMVLDIYFIVLTDNRASLLGLVFLIIGALFNLKKKHYFRISPVLVASLPVIIAAIYLVLVNSGAINIFGAFSGVGKELTSRVGIWNEGFDAIAVSPFFGAYYDVLYRMSSAQLHNIYVDTAATYGIPVAVAFFLFIYYSLSKVSSKINCQQQNMAYWGFCAIMLIGSFEAALVSGSSGMYIMSCSLLVLASQEPLQGRYLQYTRGSFDNK